MNKLVESYNNWCKDSNIFECYVKSTTLASIAALDSEDLWLDENYAINKLNKDNFEKLKLRLGDNLSNTFIISDLHPEENLDFSILLNNNLSIKPILSFNHIAHKHGLVGNSVIHNKIVNYPFRFENIEGVKSYCFLLDNSRYRDNDDYLDSLVFNNQYEITEEEVPYIEVLKMMNIERLIFIYRNIIKEDIKKYLEYLEEEKIGITLIDLEN